jgi:signal transduction histidine kinase
LFFHVFAFGQPLDIFLNGKRLHTHGKFATDSTTFKRPVLNDIYTFLPLALEADSVYTLAIHYLHMPLAFHANLFETDETGRFGFLLVTYKYLNSFRESRIQTLNVNLFRAPATAMITLLCWLFFLYNRKDKTILLISISVTGFLIIQAAILFASGSFPISVNLFYLMDKIVAFGITLVLGSLPLIFAKIFTGSIPRFLWLVPLLIIVHWVIRMTTVNELGQILYFILIGAIICICVYYIIRSWKSLHGAQWAIIIGILLFLLIFFANLLLSHFALDRINADYFISFLFYLGYMVFPFSLIVYIVMRFGESQKEVKNNAAKVVKVTEEKRQLAIAQQVVLEKQVKERTEELSRSLDHLKATQAQLIHSEKMASLGELTAGIAHEIQNPLNFVNNFSEVSGELLEELEEELQKGDLEEVQEISQDLRNNLHKIYEHGKRADSIVKGMLLHSRSSTGEKVKTDINALCDEYLRLAYHGMRAKNRNFNVEFHTDFDPNLPKVSVVPQDIGRVLLNIINNAFQAVADHGPRTTDNSNVTVASKFLKDKVQLIISDNGPGIPDEIKDKIFQPFFTTKPTGQGTGLGLSLSYDIVKAHGGEIKVKSEFGKGTSFFIVLPIGNNRS